MPLLLPLIPPLLEGLGLGFVAFAAAATLFGLSATHSSVHGSENTQSFWQWMARGGPLLSLLGLGIQAGRYVVSHFAASNLRVLSRWLLSMGSLTGALLVATPYAFESLLHAIERVQHRGDPQARAKAQAASRRAIAAGRSAAHANGRARSVGHSLDTYKGRTEPQIRHLTHATTVTLPRDIANVKHRERWAEREQWKLRDRVKGLEDGAIKTWDWIRSNPATAAATAFAGAVAAALTSVGNGWLGCKENPFSSSNNPCSLWGDLARLMPLLGLLTLAFDFPEFCTAAKTVAGGIGDAVAGVEGVFSPSLPPLPPPQ